MKNILKLSNNFFLTLLISNFSLNAQVRVQNRIDKGEIVFHGNHMSINFSLLSTFKANLKRLSGDHYVKTTMTQGMSLGFKYSKTFNKYYSFIIGPEAIVVGRDFITSFNKTEFSPPLIKDYKLGYRNSYLSDLIISLSLFFEKRIFYNQANYFLVDVGGRLNFSTGADFDIFSIYLLNTNNQVYDAGGTDVYANNDQRPWISVPINIGHSWLLKNNNLLQLTLCSNISFTKYVNGTYQINIPNRPLTEGQYSSTGSYVGLSLNYVFTSANYRLRRAYEKLEKGSSGL